LIRRHAKFGEERTIIGGVLAYFRFSKGGRPPSWICYDVITDHPRLQRFIEALQNFAASGRGIRRWRPQQTFVS